MNCLIGSCQKALVFTNTLSLVLLVVIVACSRAQESEVYFSSLRSIRVVSNRTAVVVFQDPSHTGNLVCNPNPGDRRIYWIDMETENPQNGNSIPLIKKGIPNDEDSIEEVVSRDLHNPKGLAVDWAANNIYFSQQRDIIDSPGRIEVVSSDGQKRKVLFNTQKEKSVGSMAINILTGHLYFVEGNSIRRCDLDGSNLQTVFRSSINFYTIRGLSIDITSNTLFWADEILTHNVRAYDMDLFQGNEILESSPGIDIIIGATSMPLFEVTAFNNSIYWTVSREMDRTFQNVTSPGSLYHSRVDSLPVVGQLLVEDTDIDPHGVCTFYNVTAMNSPCHNSNVCGEDAFCFTIPDPATNGTRARCGCPTGLTLNSDNRTCSDVPQHFLLYSQHFAQHDQTTRTELRIIPLDDTEGEFVDIQLPIDLHFTKSVFVTYDTIQHKVYWTEDDPPTIMRANIDGTGAEVFINTSIKQAESLAIDPFSRNLYWADSGLEIISVARLDNPLIRRVLIRGVDHPQGLAIDVARGFLYWSDVETNTPSVERAHMDGTNRVILSQHGIQLPSNVAVDPLTGYAYWIERDVDDIQSEIIRYVDRVETPLAISSPDLRSPLGLAVDGDYVYWTDTFSTSRTIGRASKFYGQRAATLVDGVSGLGGLVVVNASSPNVNTMCAIGDPSVDVEGRCNHLCLPSGNATPTCTCAENYVQREGSTICEDPPPIVFIANSTYLTRLDASGSVLQLTSTAYPLPTGTQVIAMDVSVKDSLVFWIDGAHKQICSQSWTTSSQNCIVTCCLDSPEDLAVDWFSRNIYWTDSQRQVIEMSNFMGRRRIIVARASNPSYIALDPYSGYLYWASKTSSCLYRTRMDGSQQDSELVRDFNSANGVLGLALNFSISGDLQIYWAVRNSINQTLLLRSDVGYAEDVRGGTRVRQYETIRGANPPHEPFSNRDLLQYIQGLTVFSEYVLFNSRARNPTIAEASVQIGSNENFVFNQDFEFSQFVYSHHSNQQGEHHCGVSSCVDNAGLCLVENSVNGTCRCWAQSIKMTIYPDSSNSLIPPSLPYDTCVDTDSFLVLATNSSFNYLPINIPGSDQGEVNLLPFFPGGSVVDLAYDPVNDSILWVESGSNILHGVDLSLESQWEVPLSSDEQLDTFSMAYDWRGGHIVLTEADAFQLKLVTSNGRGQGSLLDLVVERPSVIEKPGEVVFDSERSILYWTQRHAMSNLSQGIRYMHLSDLSQISTIDIGSRLINQLTFEPVSRSLYWIAHDGPSIRVERYSLDAGNFTVIAENAAGVEALAALSVANGNDIRPYVYWFNRTDKYVYNSTVDGVFKRHVKWNASESVIKILGHRKIPTSTSPCLAEDRPCSHICVPGGTVSSNSFSCNCPVYSTSDGNFSCIASTCGPHAISCGDDFGECYPRVYFCDGIRHCKNNFDEQCSCNLTVENGCYMGPGESGPTICYSHQERCDNSSQCPHGEDESMCCGDDMFGCYVDTDREGVSIFQCLVRRSLCDGVIDCVDASDEQCTPSILITTLAATNPSASIGENTLPIIISAVIISIIFVVVSMVIVVYVLSVFWRKRDEYRVGQHHSISYSTQSPQLRNDSTSDFSSEFSHNTNITQVANGSNAQSPCGDKAAAAANLASTHNIHMMNPPPSPISTIQPRHSLALSEDEVSTISHGLSEYNAPPPPCPSINYDNVSGNMSFSVSQTQFPATINGNAGGSSNNYHFQYPQGNMTGGGGMRPPGRNVNPLLATRNPQFGNTGGGGGVSFYLYQMRGMPAHQTNHIHYNNPYHHSCRAHPDITELDNPTHSDTDSTVSIATEEGNPDTFHFDSSMPHLPPPGRPPSPVTICSYPPEPPPHSPLSSTTSFSSEV